MADATPIKAVFNASNVATGLAEFQSSDTIALSDGGTGVSLSLGTAGQALVVNSGGTAIEFGTISTAGTALTGTTLASGITASSLTTVGTLTTLTVDNVIINGTTIGHTDDTDLITLDANKVTISGDIVINSTGTLTLPSGGTDERPNVVNDGMIRYNTDLNTYEGYSNSNWQGLGGVIDVDRDTYIYKFIQKPEKRKGQNSQKGGEGQKVQKRQKGQKEARCQQA